MSDAIHHERGEVIWTPSDDAWALSVVGRFAASRNITKTVGGSTLTPGTTAAEIVLYPISAASLSAGDSLEATVGVRTVDAGTFQVHAEMTLPSLPADTIDSQVITVE